MTIEVVVSNESMFLINEYNTPLAVRALRKNPRLWKGQVDEREHSFELPDRVAVDIMVMVADARATRFEENK